MTDDAIGFANRRLTRSQKRSLTAGVESPAPVDIEPSANSASQFGPEAKRAKNSRMKSTVSLTKNTGNKGKSAQALIYC